MFVLSHLSIQGEREAPAILLHFREVKSGSVSVGGVRVRFRDPKDGLWKGPVELLFSGRGYMCVSTGEGLRWIPAKWVKASPDGGTPVLEQRLDDVRDNEDQHKGEFVGDMG